MNTIRRAFLAIAAAAVVMVPLGATAASAHQAQPAKRASTAMFLTNDPQINMRGNGLGQQIITSLEGNAMNMARVSEGSACGDTIYSFHNAGGDWFRVPSGSNTLNLSTIRDQRAEFLGEAAANGGMRYFWFGAGCNNISVIETANRTGVGVFVRPLPNGAYDNWTIR